MSDYTPTTEQIRYGYSTIEGAENVPWLRKNAEEHFDRWLEEHDRQVSERVWLEGYKSGKNSRTLRTEYPNPHCKGEEQ